MKWLTVDHPKYGRIEYSDNFWGKKTLVINGVKLPRKARNTFVLNTSDGSLDCKLRHKLLMRIYLCIGEEKFLVFSIKWYEFLLLYSIFMMSVPNPIFMTFIIYLFLLWEKTAKKIWQKLLIGLVCLFLSYLSTLLTLILIFAI